MHDAPSVHALELHHVDQLTLRQDVVSCRLNTLDFYVGRDSTRDAGGPAVRAHDKGHRLWGVDANHLAGHVLRLQPVRRPRVRPDPPQTPPVHAAGRTRAHRSWLDAGGVGIDTAFDYGDQQAIASILHPWLKAHGKTRSDVFLTSKVPAGLGGPANCKADPNVALDKVKADVEQLGVEQVDLVLLHAPCGTAAQGAPPPPPPCCGWGLTPRLGRRQTTRCGRVCSRPRP